MIKGIIKPEDLETPISFEGIKKIFKRGNIRGLIFYEDNSFDQIWFKLKKNFYIEYRKRIYLVFPKCLLHGKTTTIMWYFNNPCPILFKHTKTIASKNVLKNSSSKAEITRMFGEQKPSSGEVYLDSEALKSVIDSNIINSMYYKEGINAKTLIIVLVVIVIIILIFLQVFGVVDVYGMFQQGAGIN